MLYDLIIIGAGPAGITAGVYAARKRMNFVVLTVDVGGQTTWSGDIENYTGYQFITGPELTAKFEEHMRKYQIELKENEQALEITQKDGIITVKTDKGVYKSKTLIVASGKDSKMLGVPGEKEYKNKGIFVKDSTTDEDFIFYYDLFNNTLNDDNVTNHKFDCEDGVLCDYAEELEEE